jgi:hypothetical protein
VRIDGSSCEWRAAARAENLMRLNPPTLLMFLIALVFAVLAIITKVATGFMPRFIPHQEFWLAIIAYLTLMIGNLVRGL